MPRGFRRIKGYPRYMVSAKGEVFSTVSASILKPQMNGKGYLRVDLYGDGGQRKRGSISRLVAEAYIPNPEGKPEVNHKDGDIHNNNRYNLEWVTSKENHRHAQEMRSKLLENDKDIPF